MFQFPTSTTVVLAALHMGWLKFLAVFLQKKIKLINIETCNSTRKDFSEISYKYLCNINVIDLFAKGKSFARGLIKKQEGEKGIMELCRMHTKLNHILLH